MRDYDLMYIHKVKDEEIINKSTEKLENIIKKLKGNIKKTDVWGIKNLPSEIGDETQGVYILISFQLPPQNLKEFNKRINIEEDILRSMIIRKSDTSY